MPIITIQGQLGSSAPMIGEMVASRLKIDYVDRKIIAHVAAKLNYPEQKIVNQEMPPATLFKRIQEALEHSYSPLSDTAGVNASMMYLSPSEIPLDDKSYLAGLVTTIKELAASNAIVIRGRGSQFILKDYPGAIHVLTIAPLEIRIKRIMEGMNLDEKAARQEINRFDSSHREFTKRYFKAELEDPKNYDLVINTKYISFENAASIIIKALPLKTARGNKAPAGS